MTSGPSVDEQAHIVAITKPMREKFIDLSGKTDLLTLAALVGQAQLLVTVDSAPVHFAACLTYAAGDPVRADESVSLAANG